MVVPTVVQKAVMRDNMLVDCWVDWKVGLKVVPMADLMEHYSVVRRAVLMAVSMVVYLAGPMVGR